MHDAASILTICMYKMQLVPFSHKSQIIKLPFYLESTTVPGGLLVRWYLSSMVLPICMEQPGFMRRLSLMCVGVRSFLEISVTP